MIHKRCPSCGASGQFEGFRIRGQFCACGWGVPPSKNEYRVIFEIDAEGKSPRDAAEYVYAKHFCRDPEAVGADDACCFTVIDDEAGEAWNVDLAEDGAERLPTSKPSSDVEKPEVPALSPRERAYLLAALDAYRPDELTQMHPAHEALPLGEGPLNAAEVATLRERLNAGGTPEPITVHGLAHNADQVARCGVNRYDHDCVPDDEVHCLPTITCLTCLRDALREHLGPAKLPDSFTDMVHKAITHGRVVAYVPPQTIRLDIWRGVVDGAHGVPPGVVLEVHDMDPNYEDKPHCELHPDEHCAVHEFRGGE